MIILKGKKKVRLRIYIYIYIKNLSSCDKLVAYYYTSGELNQ